TSPNVMHEQLATGEITGDEPSVAVQVEAADVAAAVAVRRQEHLDRTGPGVATVNGSVGHAAHEEGRARPLGNAFREYLVTRNREEAHGSKHITRQRTSL